jgi:hypothetical protein
VREEDDGIMDWEVGNRNRDGMGTTGNANRMKRWNWIGTRTGDHRRDRAKEGGMWGYTDELDRGDVVYSRTAMADMAHWVYDSEML